MADTRQVEGDVGVAGTAGADADQAGSIQLIHLAFSSLTRPTAAMDVAQWMRPRRVRNSAATLGKKCYIHCEPKGVVLNLSTWNAPVAIGLVPAIAAIAAGNAFALKPSELAPHSATVLREVIDSVFSPDEFAVFEGGPEVAQALLQHARKKVMIAIPITLIIQRKPDSIFDYQFEDFEVLGYEHHAAIKAPVAV